MEDDIRRTLKTIRNILIQEKKLIGYNLVEDAILESLKIAETMRIISLSKPEIEYLMSNTEPPSTLISDLISENFHKRNNTDTTINRKNYHLSE